MPYSIFLGFVTFDIKSPAIDALDLLAGLLS
jgi:hypothetical protein